MTVVNLMPRARCVAVRRSARVRFWGVALAGYGLLLAAGWAGALSMAAGSAQGVDRMVSEANAEAEAGEKMVKELRAEVSALSVKVGAARAIAEHPDWSILLGLIAGARGEDVVLETVDLSAAPVGAKSAPGKPAAFVLRLAGAARTHQAVTQFTLRMESTGLFEKVSLGDTRAVDREGTALVAFQVECSLTDGGRKQP